MPFPEFLDMVKYHSDPENYLNVNLTDNEIEDRKESIEGALKRLRKE